MTKNEVVKYINSSYKSAVCVHRDLLSGYSLLVMSVYISGRVPDCVLSIEFDPIDLVDHGEGWTWKSSIMNLDLLISKLEGFLSKDILYWENITKSGRLLDFEGEVDDEQYLKEELAFTQELQLGEKLLPDTIDWVRNTCFLE